MYIREKNGQYRRAKRDEVINAARAVLDKRVIGKELTNPDMTKDYLKIQLGNEQREIFALLCLNNRHHVLAFDRLFTGTIDGASVYPREVVKRALELNAKAVIFAHNHPSGIPEPSPADEQITKRLKDALALIDVRVLDHIVIGGNDSVSFAERGLI